ncbi:MAG: hypothetical protein INR69_10325, partial [Mucilaginibacter polytrichastri]|nr:hypothetical protein [Mucilaginibacter polytrichastri]
MELTLKRPYDLKKLELWAATALYALAIIFMIPKVNTQGIQDFSAPNKYGFDNGRYIYSFFANYFMPQLVRYSVAF